MVMARWCVRVACRASTMSRRAGSCRQRAASDSPISASPHSLPARILLATRRAASDCQSEASCPPGPSESDASDSSSDSSVSRPRFVVMRGFCALGSSSNRGDAGGLTSTLDARADRRCCCRGDVPSSLVVGAAATSPPTSASRTSSARPACRTGRRTRRGSAVVAAAAEAASHPSGMVSSIGACPSSPASGGASGSVMAFLCQSQSPWADDWSEADWSVPPSHRPLNFAGSRPACSLLRCSPWLPRRQCRQSTW